MSYSFITTHSCSSSKENRLNWQSEDEGTETHSPTITTRFRGETGSKFKEAPRYDRTQQAGTQAACNPSLDVRSY